MKILHLAAPNKNVGDNALISGVKNLFSTHQLILKNIRSTIIDINFINIINTEYDAVIIGGGGLLHSTPITRKQKNNSSGTLIRLDTNNIQKIKKPIIVYGVGYNVFNNEIDLCKLAKKSILDIMKHSLHFSVRNDGSRERLSKFLDINVDNIIEAPDPGLYCDFDTNEYNNLDSKTKKIAIQIAADRLDCRFNNKKNIAIFISEIKSFITNNKHQCWLVPHTQLDYEFISRHFSEYPIYSLKNFQNFASTAKVMGFYKKMDCVIGQRGHANICPFGMRIPIISLVSHPKNIGFMKKINFDSYSINCDDPTLASKLSNLVDSIDENYRVQQDQVVNKLKYLSNKITENINEKLHN